MSVAPRITSLRATIGAQLAYGQYGTVHAASAIVGDAVIDAVAKRAEARASHEGADAQAVTYLEVEAVVNTRLAAEVPPDRYGALFAKYLGEVERDGERWLLWQRVGRPDGVARSLADFGGDAKGLQAATGLTPRDVLRQLLEAASALHEIGFVHRDIKPENVLVDGTSLRLIDMGSCAQLEGCPALERASACLGYDASRSPCTPEYAAPEKFVDPLHPWAFDVYSIAITLLKLCWPLLRAPTDGAVLGTGSAVDDTKGALGLTRFREQLERSGHDLDAWLRIGLGETALDPLLSASLDALPAGDASLLAMLRAMLVSEAARRPSIDALLTHPCLSGNAAGGATNSGASASGKEAKLFFSPSALNVQLEGFEPDGCVLPAWAVEEHPIALSVRLQPPLGLLLGELRAGGVTLDGFVDGLASAAAREALRIGDRLVRIEHTPVRRASVEQISALISARSRGGKDVVLLTFERDCGVETGDECPLPTEAVETLESMLASGGASAPDRSPAATGTAASPIVVAAGAASIIGGRSTQEDTTILTMLEVTPPGSASSTRFTLAGVFDGHRGPRASAHAAATLPAAVKEALSRVAFATKDHSASDEAEIERIREGGGNVACGRGGVMRVAVDCPEGNWLVAVPRALGGSQWADAGICDTADVTTLRLDSRHAFILLGSDGVWGPFDGVGGASEGAERVACLVAEARATSRSPAPSAGEVAEMVVARAEGSGGTDNASCVILYLA
ncbi:hypothetical protein Ctob_010043 [Chrysochromulina tobinii]|uniref:Uncharacterized protein n=1 Tax=Chrysochromulina tobinii TaxID=1460289 RepID=A0A0M0JNE8_9EUKA|nr:hypothetical protein Ctob_010043 [Chrysochromulina tobinii]|eukprot:KOO28106.1 hypothetical protein Ctob_010043 [Chrysochromulina sp. CCMP291]